MSEHKYNVKFDFTAFLRCYHYNVPVNTMFPFTMSPYMMLTAPSKNIIVSAHKFDQFWSDFN